MQHTHTRHPFRWHWTLVAAGAVLLLAVLVALYHIAVSRVAGHVIQNSLDDMDTNNTFAETIEYGDFFGADGISRIEITRRDREDTNPILIIKDLRVAPDLMAALRGTLALDLSIRSAGVNILRSDIERIRSTLDVEEGRRLLTSLREAPINQLTVGSAYTTFFDASTNPPVNLAINNIEIEATNMVDLPGREGEPAHFVLTGNTFGEGYLDAFAEVELFEEQPQIWAEITLEDLALADVQSAIQAYTSVAVEKGALNVASRLQLREQQLQGFLRQAILDLELAPLEDPSDVISLQTLALLYKKLRDDEDGNFAGTAEFNTNISQVEGGRVQGTFNVLKQAYMHTLDLEETERLEADDLSKTGRESRSEESRLTAQSSSLYP